MLGHRIERRLAAILAADVVGYSRLMGWDEEGTLDRLKAHRKELVEPLIAEHRGRIVNFPGDSVLCEFASVVDAVACAVALQEGMHARERDLAEAERIRFRVGVNLGEVLVEGDEIYGDGVNIAARLEGLAEPGGICVSGKVREELRKRFEIVFAPMGRQRVKNIAEPIEAWRVVWGVEKVPLARDVSRIPGRLRRVGAATVGFLLLVCTSVGGWIWYWNSSSLRSDLDIFTWGSGPALSPGNSDGEFVSDERHAVQRSLNYLGYYTGPMDGQFSYKLRNSIRDFQLAQGVPGTGHLTVLEAVELHRLSVYESPPQPLPQLDLAKVQQLSESGDPEGQRLRGMLHDTWYQDGGLPKHNAQAAYWYKKAAVGGDPLAALNLGWILKDGDGVEPDLAEAIRWLEFAAQEGEPLAFLGLADLYLRGQGISKDEDLAVRFYREAVTRSFDDADRGVAIANLRALGAWKD